MPMQYLPLMEWLGCSTRTWRAKREWTRPPPRFTLAQDGKASMVSSDIGWRGGRESTLGWACDVLVSSFLPNGTEDGSQRFASLHLETGGRSALF